MKISLKPKLLPWLTLGAGGIGLALRVWLFSLRDSKGLLPAGHIADVLTFVLTAAFMAVLFLCVQPLGPISRYSRLFPASPVRAVGCGLGGAGILYAAIRDVSGSGALGIAALVVGIGAAAALAYAAYCRLKGIHPTCLVHALPALYLMLHAVLQVRTWSSETQLSVYFFPLLAVIFLMITAYHYGVLDLKKSSRRWFVFCNQAALFCCCLSFNGNGGLFYMGMAAWMACDLCALSTRPPRHLARQEVA